MKRYQLKATKRAETGTSSSRQLRQQLHVPAVLYGRDMESEQISVSQSEVLQIINTGSANALIDLSVGRKKYTTMLKDIQLHPIKRDITHIDFYVVAMDRPITTTVPISIVGEAAGVSEGGTVQYQAREIEVKCLPGDIPERIEFDVSELVIGDTRTVADLELPEDIELLTPESEVVVTVLAPRMPEEEELEDEGELPEGEEAAEEGEQEAEEEEEQE